MSEQSWGGFGANVVERANAQQACNVRPRVVEFQRRCREAIRTHSPIESECGLGMELDDGAAERLSGSY
jgi:hypothetical protein